MAAPRRLFRGRFFPTDVWQRRGFFGRGLEDGVGRSDFQQLRFCSRGIWRQVGSSGGLEIRRGLLRVPCRSGAGAEGVNAARGHRVPFWEQDAWHMRIAHLFVLLPCLPHNVRPLKPVAARCCRRHGEEKGGWLGLARARGRCELGVSQPHSGSRGLAWFGAVTQPGRRLSFFCKGLAGWFHFSWF